MNILEFFQIKNVLPLSPHVFGTVLGFPVTDTMFMSVVNFFIVLLLCFIASKFTVKNPGKLQLAIESIYTFVVDSITQVSSSAKVAWQLMPVVGSLVLFMLISNLSFAFLPFLSGFTLNGQALFRSSTNDASMTLALSIGMFVLYQVISIGVNGPLLHFGRYLPLHNMYKKLLEKDVLGIVIEMFLGVLEFVGDIAKIVSLGLRLLGNMFAGELITSILVSAFALVLPLPIMFLGLLVGVVQSLVFGSLVTATLSSAMNSLKVEKETEETEVQEGSIIGAAPEKEANTISASSLKPQLNLN